MVVEDWIPQTGWWWNRCSLSNEPLLTAKRGAKVLWAKEETEIWCLACILDPESGLEEIGWVPRRILKHRRDDDEYQHRDDEPDARRPESTDTGRTGVTGVTGTFDTGYKLDLRPHVLF